MRINIIFAFEVKLSALSISVRFVVTSPNRESMVRHAKLELVSEETKDNTRIYTSMTHDGLRASSPHLLSPRQRIFFNCLESELMFLDSAVIQQTTSASSVHASQKVTKVQIIEV